MPIPGMTVGKVLDRSVSFREPRLSVLGVAYLTVPAVLCQLIDIIRLFRLTYY